MRTSSKLATLALAMAALVVAAAPRANADTCATATASGGNTATLCYVLTPTSLTIDSFTVDGHAIPPGTGKLLAVGVDNGATLAASGWSLDSATPNCDGLSHSCNLYSGSSSTNFTSSVAFTLTGSPNDIFVHIGGFTFSSCSVWLEISVTGSTANTVTNSSGLDSCGGTPPPVPEPGTLGLLGTGLVGLAGLVRRRFRS